MMTFGRPDDDAVTTGGRLSDDTPTTFGRRLGGFRNVAGRFPADCGVRSRRPSRCIDRGGLGPYFFRGLFTAGVPVRTVNGGRQFSLPQGYPRMLEAIAKRMFGSANDRFLKGLGKDVDAINALEPSMEAWRDEDPLRDLRHTAQARDELVAMWEAR